MADSGGSNTGATLKTIADELSMSVTTAPRAPRDGHKISPKTIEKVRETAARLGYVRNLEGLILRTGKALAVMALLGHTNEEEIGDSGSVGLLSRLITRYSGSEYTVRTIPVTIGEYLGTAVHASYYSCVLAGWMLADLFLRRTKGTPVEVCQSVVRTELRLQGGLTQ